MAAKITDKPFDEEIELQDHNPAWEDRYREEVAELEQTLFAKGLSELIGGFQHFGSTSIPGIKAKPVIGIMCGVFSWPPDDRVIEAFQEKDYMYYGQMGHRPRQYLRKRIGTQHFNIHIVEFEDGVWRDNLLFREYMIHHPQEISEYQKVKEQALQISEGRLNEYGSIKYEFLKDRTKRAILWQECGRDDTKLKTALQIERKRKAYRAWRRSSIKRVQQVQLRTRVEIDECELQHIASSHPQILNDYCESIGLEEARVKQAIEGSSERRNLAHYWAKYKQNKNMRVQIPLSSFWEIWFQGLEEQYPGVIGYSQDPVGTNIFSPNLRQHLQRF